jgi:2-keto-3-deoxy-L-rhamnonate aldolase RhmA
MRALLASGRLIRAITVDFPTPALVEFCGLLGFDLVRLDGEHQPIGVETCYDLVRAADAVGVATRVRVPANRPELLLSYAESGVDVVDVPHVRTVADAEALVAGLRMPPAGTRGVNAYSRAANYGLTQQASEYYGAWSHHTMPLALLEDVEAFENIDGIAAVDGLELYSIGPSDLSASLGVPGDFEDPRVQDYLTKAVEAIKRNGKTLVASSGTPRQQQWLRENGSRITMASVRVLLGQAAGELLAGTGRR